MAEYDYNKYYKELEYFGQSYPELVAYFSTLSRDKKVLDIGCGQGRDSLAIGRLGFSVVGVDISSVGIEQMNQVAMEEGIDVKGIVSDLNDLYNISDYDIVLMDSMFHFYKKDFEKETKLLESIISNLKTGSIIVVFIQENKHRVKHIKSIFSKKSSMCIIEHEECLIYEEFNSKFFMIASRKL